MNQNKKNWLKNSIIVAIIVVMVLDGPFDKVFLDTYHAGIYESRTYSAGVLAYPAEDLDVTMSDYCVLPEEELDDELPSDALLIRKAEEAKHCLKLTKQEKDALEVDKEKLNDTLDKLLSKAMSKFDYAFDEKYITRKMYCKDENGKWYLYVTVLATCIDYKQETEDVLKWKDIPDFDRRSIYLSMCTTGYYINYIDFPYDYLEKAGELSTKTYMTISNIIVEL